MCSDELSNGEIMDAQDESDDKNSFHKHKLKS